MEAKTVYFISKREKKELLMYPQYGSKVSHLSCSALAPIKPVQPTLFSNGFTISMLMAFIILLVPSAYAAAPGNDLIPTASLNSSSAANQPFYRQLLRPGKKQQRFQAIKPWQHMFVSDAPAAQGQDRDLAFNYLWMQQYQPGYQQREGGAAVGKLLRMGVNSMYKSYTGRNLNNSNPNADIGSTYSNVDYRVRLSGNKVKLGFKYEF
jgi:hypothetical protein